MKKFVSLSIVLSFSILLVACESDRDNKSTKESRVAVTSEKTVESSDSTKESSKKETDDDFVSSAADAYFDGSILKGNSYSIKITSHKVIQPGEKGNEYGENAVIAFSYDTLVSSDYDNSRPIKPSLAWISNFEAVQDNDSNMVNKLNVASLPDDAFLDSQSAEIKPGGTVSNAIAYELTDNETPVTLIAKSYTKEFGKADFAIK